MGTQQYRPRFEHAVAMLEEEKTGERANAYDIINVTRRALARAGVAQGTLDDYFDEATSLYAQKSAAVGTALKSFALRALIHHARSWCMVAVPLSWQRELGMLPGELE